MGKKIKEDVVWSEKEEDALRAFVAEYGESWTAYWDVQIRRTGNKYECLKGLGAQSAKTASLKEMPSTNHEHPTPTKKQKNNPASTPKKQKNNPASTPKKQKDNPTPPEEVKENPSPKEPKENATQDESTTSPTKSFAEHKHNSPGKPQIYLDLTPNKNEDYKLKVKRMFEDIQVSGLYVMDHSYMPMEPTAPHLIAQDALTRFGKFDVVIDNLFRPLLGAYRRQASVFLYSFLINKISHVFLFLGKFRDFVILNNVFVQEERHVSPEMINKEWAILRDNLPENVIVTSLQAMTNTMMKPPKHFEEFWLVQVSQPCVSKALVLRNSTMEWAFLDGERWNIAVQ
ncbi:hypothetical protein Tco_0675742 [Tanacetum coccineum]